MRKIIVAFVVLVFVLGGANFWISQPFNARVIDDQGRPLREATVAVAWVFRSGHVTSPFVINETITDEKGDFAIPGWGAFSPLFMGHLRGGVTIFIVKRGFHPTYMESSADAMPGLLNATPNFNILNPMHPITPDSHEKATLSLGDMVGNMCFLSSGPLLSSFFRTAPRLIAETRELEKVLKYSTLKLNDCGIHIDR